MTNTHFWNGVTGKCGSVLNIEPSYKQGRSNIFPRNKNKWFGKSDVIADIPNEAIVEFTAADFPGLGTERLILIIADSTGSSPLLKKLNMHQNQLAEQLAQSKEREMAALAGKAVAEQQKSETAKDIGDRLVDEIDKIKKAGQSDQQYARFGRGGMP